MILEEKTTIFIAIGSSIGSNCQPCLQYYVKRALESGIDERELQAAINMAKTVSKGATHKMDLCIAELFKENSDSVKTRKNGCECGC